jgi:hypothetical protein
MTDPYAETDDWIVPATRPHSDAQPVSAPEPSGSTPEAGEGGRVARYAEAATELGADGILAVARLETQVDRLNAAIERARMERALAEDAETAATDRAEAAEAESARLASVVAKVEAIIADPDFANGHVSVVRVAAALASVAPDTATPGEVWVDTPDDFEGYDTATPGEVTTEPERWPFGLTSAAALVARVAWPMERDECQAQWSGRLVDEPNIRAATIASARRRFESAISALNAASSADDKAGE